MSFLDRVTACNRYDIADFVAFKTDGATVGWVRPSMAELMASTASLFVRQDDSIKFASDLNTADSRTAALASQAENWVAQGHVASLRGEIYSARKAWSTPDLFRLDRGLVPYFGIRAYGIHVNGYVRRNDDLFLWIGTRNSQSRIAPGKFDNIVAGGQPAHLTIHENLIKECKEEADIPSALAAQARATGTVTYCFDSERGLKPDTLFCFDLEVPDDFEPANQDGEIENFRLMSVKEALNEIKTGEAFKFNVALVILDFAIRHGVLTPDGEPDYEAILRGLHAPPPSALGHNV